MFIGNNERGHTVEARSSHTLAICVQKRNREARIVLDFAHALPAVARGLADVVLDGVERIRARNLMRIGKRDIEQKIVFAASRRT